MKARIYKPTKSAMQSGTANVKHWKLEFEPNGDRYIEPLMGWTATSDMTQEIELWFETKEQAIDYAERNDIPYDVYDPETRVIKPKSYADNFK
jgi:hypothetical protein